jgi:hypothetical protein
MSLIDPAPLATDEHGELLERYRKDGFVAVRGLVERGEIEALRPAVDEAVATRIRNDPRPFTARSPYEQAFRQCISIWEDFPAVRPLTFHPKIAGFAARLLGVDKVRLWHDQALYKEPGGRETEAHQDHAYWPVAEPDLITAWIPLVDVDEESGCMGYVPGTQASPLEYVDIFLTPGAGHAFAARHEAPVFLPARVGDVIYHAARTVHMAKANRSPRTRAVHTVVYFRDGCTCSPGVSDHPTDRNGTKIGQPINGPATPIAWPLPPGFYPPPAPWPERAEVPEHFIRTGVVRPRPPAERG